MYRSLLMRVFLCVCILYNLPLKKQTKSTYILCKDCRRGYGLGDLDLGGGVGSRTNIIVKHRLCTFCVGLGVYFVCLFLFYITKCGLV